VAHIVKVDDKYGSFEDVKVERDVFSRGMPEPGDYLVRYDGGYMSWSPKQPFEDGYSPVEGAL
jgi:hypothetical protein